ncbi:hypothetical protein ACWDOR_04485 [Streptosporangium canum]
MSASASARGLDDPGHRAVGEQPVAQPRQVGVGPDLLDELLERPGLAGQHDLQRELVLGGGLGGERGQQLSLVGGRGPELAERREEVVMARLGARGEAPHRPRAHDLVGEVRVGGRVANRPLTGAARRRRRGEGRGVDAQAVACGGTEQEIGGYGTRQVRVKIDALGQSGHELPEPARLVADPVEICLNL